MASCFQHINECLYVVKSQLRSHWATQGLVEAGKPVDGELLQFLSPLGWEHINLTGDYVWRQSRRLEDGKFRPLRMPGKP